MGDQELLLIKYNELSEYPLDEQLCIHPDNNLIKELPIEMLLRQLKYANNHKMYGKAYNVLRSHLVDITSESLVSEMEGL